MPWDLVLLVVINMLFPLRDDYHYIGDTLDREYEETRRDTRPIPPTAYPDERD